MPHEFKKVFFVSIFSAWIAAVSGCSSPPDTPQPVGKRIAVNPVQPTPPERINAVLLPELKDL